MSTNGTAYKDKVVLGKTGGFAGAEAVAVPDLASVPAGQEPGSLSMLGTGNATLVDSTGALRVLLPESAEAQPTVISGAGPQQLQSAVLAAKGQRFLSVDTSNGQVQAYLQPASESDGEVIHVRHDGGDVPAQVLSSDPEDGVNGGAGQTFALNPKTAITLAGNAATKTWTLVGLVTDADRTAS